MPSKADLTLAVDTNLFRLYEAASPDPGTRVAGEAYSYVRLAPSPWGNCVYGLDLRKAGAVAELKAKTASGELPSLILTGPSSKPANAVALLAEGGFVETKKAYGMTLRIRERKPAPVDTDFECSEISEDAVLREWARIVCVNLFGAPEEKAVDFHRVVSRMAGSRIAFFLGKYRGTPASTSMYFIDAEGMAGYYFVSTEAAFRRRGFGSMITAFTMDRLAERKSEFCILQATELGRGVYESLGFETACLLGRYSLPR
jgi:hypothetical protein